MSDKKLVPKLRFRDFESVFSKYKFSDLVEKKSKTYNPNKELENYRCVELESLSQGTGQLLKVFDSKDLKSNKTRFSRGDILFGKLRPYLKKYWQADFDGVCTSEIWVMKGTRLTNPYLFYLIQTNKFNYESNVTSGSKMPRADWEYVSSIKYLIPESIEEQQKIATFLTAVDKKIALLQQKKSLLEQYKKGVMQQIFPSAGSGQVPQLRFKPAQSEAEGNDDGNDDGNAFPDWEEKRLGEVGQIITGKTPSTVNKDLWDGDIQFVTPTDINRDDKYQLKTRRTVFNTGKLKILPKKYIIYTCIASIGKMSLSIEPCITNQQINSLVPNSNFDNEYVYYSLVHITPKIKSVQANTTLPIINRTDFSKFTISVPCLEEQKKITNFLTAIDAKIQIVGTQVVNTQQFKKGLLQQLFV